MNKVRVMWKLALRRIKPIPSFCKHCGRDVRDYSAPDVIWMQLDPHIKRGHTLCYNCFCDLCRKLGLPSVWKVVPLEAAE